MNILENKQLNRLDLVKDQTTFETLATSLITELSKETDSIIILKLKAKLEELKCHFYGNMAESLKSRGPHWLKKVSEYEHDSKLAWNKLMNIYKQLPEED